MQKWQNIDHTCKMRTFVGIIVVGFLCFGHLSAFAYNLISNITSRCSSSSTGTQNVDCGWLASPSAGTAYFYVPNSGCSVELTTGSCSYRQAFYLNFVEADIPLGDLLEISQKSTWGTYTVVKTIAGGTISRSGPPFSTGQLLSNYGMSPSLRFRYTRSSGKIFSSHRVKIQYNMVYDYSNSWSTYCSALSGYVHDDLYCDDHDNRINCPKSYSSSNHMGNFPYGAASCGLSGGAIAGVVIGSILGMTILATVIGLVCRRSRRNAQRTTTAQVFTTNAHSASTPVIVGGYPQQQYGTVYQPQAYPAPYPAGSLPPPYPGAIGGGPMPYQANVVLPDPTRTS